MTTSLYNIPPFLRQRLRRYEVNEYVFHTVLVEKGTFMMGGDDDEAYDNEKSVHEVSIRDDFELGVHLVTQGLWRAVMGKDWPYAGFEGAERPVERVSWEDICGEGGFLEKLNECLLANSQIDEGKIFSLPTEAQWEYAARAGRYQGSLGQLYAGSNRLSEVGWYGENGEHCTHFVGQKYPNSLGLFDMSGNVWEWMEDDWRDSYYKTSGDDGAFIGSPRALNRVNRGGSWGRSIRRSRVSSRFCYPSISRLNYIGFRLARSSSPQISD